MDFIKSCAIPPISTTGLSWWAAPSYFIDAKQKGVYKMDPVVGVPRVSYQIILENHTILNSKYKVPNLAKKHTV